MQTKILSLKAFLTLLIEVPYTHEMFKISIVITESTT